MLKQAAPIAAGILVTQKVAPMIPLPAQLGNFRDIANLAIGVGAGILVHKMLG